MTMLSAMEKRFDEEKQKLKEECKPGIQYLRECIKAGHYITGECFQHLFKKKFDLKINRIELMAVDTDSKKRVYQQFLVEFEDNTTDYIYVLVGENT